MICVCGYGWVPTVKVIDIVILGMMIEICNKYYEYDKVSCPMSTVQGHMVTHKYTYIHA